MFTLWLRLKGLPGGRWLFSRFISWVVPYSGTVGANVLELEAGYAKLGLRDRRKVRNHLRSVHAIALANTGELVCGLAMLSSFKPGVRGIVKSFHIEYFKKARGYLIAECRCTVPAVTGDLDFTVTGDIRDSVGDVVASVSVGWLLGLESPPK